MVREAQLSAFRNLIRYSARLFFGGDINDVTREDPAIQAESSSRARRVQVQQKNLVVVILDALTYREWVSVDKFTEQMHLSSKQVRRVLGYLKKAGFVVMEHRRERKKGNVIESVADPFDMPEDKALTSSYVCIDYPHFFDMLRLRLYLAQKRLDDKIDDKEVVKQYVCGPNADGQPGCGHAFTSFTIMGLEPTRRGLLRCNVCDFGIVEPKIDGKSAASWRMDRDIARSQRKVLREVLQPLVDMVTRLEDVDPPDYGSFTDWVNVRAATSAGPGAGPGGGYRSGPRGGRLDYGIDGPDNGEMHINVSMAADGAIQGNTLVSQAVTTDARDSLPAFLRQDHAIGTSLEAAAPAADAAPAPKTEADVKQEAADEAEAMQEVYEAYMKQFYAEAAAKEAGMQGVSIKTLADDPGGEGEDVKPDLLAGGGLAAAPKRERESEDATAQQPKRVRAGAEAVDAAAPSAATPDATVPLTPEDGGDKGADAGDFDWEDADAGGTVPPPDDAGFEWED